jgi:hypothetical protein
MTVTTTNLLQGPALIYSGAFGVAEPAVTVGPPIGLITPGVGWTDLGATDGGVELMINDTYQELKVDQVVYNVESRRTARVVEVKTALAEATLGNLAIALNNTAPTGTGGAYFVPDDSVGFGVAFAPVYQAILFDGVAVGGFKRRFIGRKVLAVSQMAQAFKKDGQTLVPVTFRMHWVSAAIRPFIYTDAGV